MQPTQISSSRRTVLIQINIRWLRQALRLLDIVDESTYRTTRTGAHLRHVVEFYQCFLDGLEFSHIDYDARRRDETIERLREAAAQAIRDTIHTLETEPELAGERIVWVRMEDAEANGVRDCFMESSISRELQILSSHTVHHFALIAMMLRLQGVDLDADFGVAPSTLRYRAVKTAEAA